MAKGIRLHDKKSRFYTGIISFYPRKYSLTVKLLTEHHLNIWSFQA